MSRVQNKVCLVTGAASGIGRACAELLANEGAVAVLADVDTDEADSVAARMTSNGVAASALELDVTRELAWEDAIHRVLQRYGRFDVLVNNAGISLAAPIPECSLEEWRQVLAVNLDSVFLGTRIGMQAMSEGGAIVNVASVAGITPNGGSSAYSASKAAVRMFSKAAAIECADNHTGIRVNLVSPGGVRTPMWRSQPFFQDLIEKHGGIEQAFAALEGIDKSRKFYSAQDVAETILYLASDASSHLTGVEFVMDRGHAG